ncbi:amphi-Trp domain-containing protein [Geodermatophilus sp. SYSU D00697]
MSDVKVEHKVTMTRQDAARWLRELAEGLAGDGPVTFSLARSTVELEVPHQVRAEAEIEVDGDEVELEIELTWSTRRAKADAHPDGGPTGG